MRLQHANHAPRYTAPCSRGALVADYFKSDADALGWARHVADVGADYGPFNLLVADRDRLCFVSNREPGERRVVHELSPGIWAVSNGRWGERWPKTRRAEQRLRACIEDRRSDADALFELLADADPAPEAELPATGLSREYERFLSAIFIRGARYGTRASTVIRRDLDNGVDFHERGFDHTGQPVHRIRQHWSVGST